MALVPKPCFALGSFCLAKRTLPQLFTCLRLVRKNIQDELQFVKVYSYRAGERWRSESVFVGSFVCTLLCPLFESHCKYSQ